MVDLYLSGVIERVKEAKKKDGQLRLACVEMIRRVVTPDEAPEVVQTLDLSEEFARKGWEFFPVNIYNAGWHVRQYKKEFLPIVKCYDRHGEEIASEQFNLRGAIINISWHISQTNLDSSLFSICKLLSERGLSYSTQQKYIDDAINHHVCLAVSPEIRAIAEEIYRDRRWEFCPILADALEDYGVVNGEVLSHLRSGCLHSRACWVLGGILDGVI